MSCPHGNHPDNCGYCDEIAEHEKAYGLIFDENAKLRTLLGRIFESVPPYHADGSVVFNDEIVNEWRAMNPGEQP